MTDSTATVLTCPKFESPMRSYERSGIVVDQCTGCRGLFLDRGELERLIDAEGTQEQARPERGGEEDEGPEGGRAGRRRGGFLGDLLDFGD